MLLISEVDLVLCGEIWRTIDFIFLRSTTTGAIYVHNYYLHISDIYKFNITTSELELAGHQQKEVTFSRLLPPPHSNTHKSIHNTIYVFYIASILLIIKQQFSKPLTYAVNAMNKWDVTLHATYIVLIEFRKTRFPVIIEDQNCFNHCFSFLKLKWLYIFLTINSPYVTLPRPP